MDIQYQFQLKFKSISLRKPTNRAFVFRVSLLQASNEVQQTSNCFQTEQLMLPASRKLFDLKGLPVFRFKSTKETSHGGFYIKYQIKDSSEPPASIPIGTFQMITQFQNNKQNLFANKYETKNVDIQYQIAISVNQTKIQDAITNQPNANSPEEEELKEVQQEGKASSDRQKNKNSITRGRPPLLNIARTNSGIKSKSETKFISLSPVPFGFSEQPKDVISPFMAKKESYEEKSSGLALHKKVSSLPLSQIEKVNQLLKSHQRPTEHKSQSWSISYKLKIVFLMIVIGAASLAYDTINDRFLTNPIADKGKKGHGKGHDKKKKSAKAHKGASH